MYIYQTTSIPVKITSKGFKPVQMKLNIWRGNVEFRFRIKLLAALLRLCLFSCQFKMVKLLMNSLIFFITMTYHMSWSAMYLNLDVFESLCLYN